MRGTIRRPSCEIPADKWTQKGEGTMKKRWIALLLALIMVCTLCTGMAAAAYRTILEKEGFYFFAVDGNDVWFEQEKELWLSRGGTDPRLIGEYGYITALAARGGMGYISYVKDDEVYVAQISRDGELIQEWLVTADYVQAMCAAEGTLALITGDMEAELMLLDTKTGAMQVAEDVLNPLVLCTGADGKSIIAFSILSSMLWRVDPDSMQAQEIGTPDAFPNAVYETEDGVLRILQNQPGFVKIYEYTPGGETAETGEISMGESTIFGMGLSAEHIFVQADGKLLRYNLKDFEPQASVRTLRIACDMPSGDMRFQQALRLFREKYPDVQVKQETVKEEDLVLSLMSGEAEYDILYMDPQSIDPFEKAGLFADLSTYPQIVSAMENWIDMPGILYDENGKFIRVPDTISFEVPRLHNFDLLIESGTEIPSGPIDYAAFRDLCAQAREQGFYFYATDARLAEVYSMYCALYTDPMNGVLDFETPEFRRIMEFWKQMQDEDLIRVCSFRNEEDIAWLESGEDYLFTACEFARNVTFHSDPDVRKWIYPPTPDGEAIVIAGVPALYLYEHGRQKDLAADFLSIFASPEAQAAEYEANDLYLRDLTQYSMYEQWTTPQLWDFSARFPGMNTVEHQEVYVQQWEMEKELFACAKPIRSLSSVRVPFYNNAALYLSGEITLDEFIAILNEKADIWLNE